jgi:LmbE family N-acetylglucosaminyl deacetylase
MADAWRAWLALLALAAALGCRATQDPGALTGALTVERRRVTAVTGAGPQLLCIVAHPDDETTFAGTLYQTAMQLGGAADLVVITNGEGGYKYSTLAEPIYGLELTREEVGRAELPAIRARELAAGCRILRVRDLFLLGQRDHRYTTDEREVLDPDAGVWDLDGVRAALVERLRARDYDFVLTLAPTPETHGHHKAATLLALAAVAALPPEERPVVLCAQTRDRDEAAPAFEGLTGYPETRPLPGEYRFDRTRPLGYDGRLDLRIVVAWAIAEHKSQGTLQVLGGRELELYRVFAGGPSAALARTGAFFEALATVP